MFDDDYLFDDSGDGGFDYGADSWWDDDTDLGNWMGGESSSDWDFGSDLLDMGKELGGAVWDWGVKNPGTVLSGLASGAKGVMDYYSSKDGDSAAEYQKEREAKHDQGMRDYVKSMKR